MRGKWWFVLAALTPLLAGCGGFGRVDQGRVVQYDRGKGLVTIIQDSNYREPGRPRFDVLPPLEVRVPRNPAEMGPEPEPGRLMGVDSERREFVTYDAAGQRFHRVPYTPVREERNVRGSDPRVQAGLPRIDRENRTITVYEPALRLLVTAELAEEQLGLAADTWKAGDDIRYYYKQPGQALRMMNVTRTDIGKSGK